MNNKLLKFLILISGGALAGGIFGWISRCAGGGS